METTRTAMDASMQCVAAAPAPTTWWVYIILCDDDSLYTGVSTDPERRFREHLQHPRGAKYFNGRKPQAIVYREPGHTRSSASKREAAIKKLPRPAKLLLLDAGAEPLPTHVPRGEF
jgi:putative endonuclease